LGFGGYFFWGMLGEFLREKWVFIHILYYSTDTLEFYIDCLDGNFFYLKNKGVQNNNRIALEF
jgi:hypothetical protein